MADILEEIVAYKRLEVEKQKADLPPRALYKRVETMLDDPVPSLRTAIEDGKSSGIIAEFKRKSPSKGWICENGQPDVIPLGYERAGASALSILTDEKYFGGSEQFISTARSSGVTIPILYKNFVIDEYQLFRARACGASAALLIAADLSKDHCRSLINTAHEIGLEVLLEMHDERELDYAGMEPDLCGINNRCLGTFITDVSASFRLAALLPTDAVKVSESGISSPETIRELRLAGYHGFLIGECFMRRPDPAAALKSFIENCW